MIEIARRVPGTKKVINRIFVNPLTSVNQQHIDENRRTELAETRQLIRQLAKRLERLESLIASRGNNAASAVPQPVQPKRSVGPVYLLPAYAYPPFPFGAYPPMNGRFPQFEWSDDHWELVPPKSKPVE